METTDDLAGLIRTTDERVTRTPLLPPEALGPPAATEAEYQALVGVCLRQGNWLLSPHARLLPDHEWEEQFAAYQERLERLRRLGDALRPASGRERV